MPRGRRLRAPRSLRALTWIFVAAMIAATLGTGVAIYTAQRRAIVQLVDQRIATAVDAIAHEGERPMPTPVLVKRLRMLASDRDTAISARCWSMRRGGRSAATSGCARCRRAA